MHLLHLSSKCDPGSTSTYPFATASIKHVLRYIIIKKSNRMNVFESSALWISQLARLPRWKLRSKSPKEKQGSGLRFPQIRLQMGSEGN